MELQNICIDIEIAKKLYSAGFRHDTYFLLCIDDRGNYTQTKNDKKLKGTKYIPLPTTDELLEKLPKTFEYNHYMAYLRIWFDCQGVFPQKDWFVSYETTKSWIKEGDKKLCNALAKMYLYLKEKNLLEEKTK